MRKAPLLPGNTYHIYNRGVERGDIFFTRANKLFFLRRLRDYLTPAAGDVVAYCLMPNHYHLLVAVRTDDFAASVMQPFLVSYTKSVNKQEGRVGPLFQGPYQARPVSNDGDLVYLSRYIHLNPVIAHLVVLPEEWEFSSYPDYIGLRNGTLPSPAAVLCHFSSPSAYAEYVGSALDPKACVAPELLMD